MQKFLRGCPLTTHKIHILIHFDTKRDMKFGINSSLIVEFSYTRGALQPPKLIYTYKSKLKLCILPYQIQTFLHKGALPWTPVKGFPPGPHQGPYSWTWTPIMGSCASHLMFLPPINS